MGFQAEVYLGCISYLNRSGEVLYADDQRHILTQTLASSNLRSTPKIQYVSSVASKSLDYPLADVAATPSPARDGPAA
jgi:hypothetical protein